MKKGTVAIIVSVWVSVLGTGVGLAALVNTSIGRLDTRISEVDARLSEQISELDARLLGQISDLAKGQTELRERMTRVETILGEVRALAAVQEPRSGGSAEGSTARGDGAAGILR